MTPARWIMLVAVLLLVGVGALFVVQNLGRTTDLSLDLWLVAGHLQRPVPVPTLLLGTFAGGLGLGWILGLVGRMGANRRISELEQDLARASLGRGNSASTTSPRSSSASAGSDDPWG